MLKAKGLAVAAFAAVMSMSVCAAAFTDVDSDAWYNECVGYVSAQGLFDSNGDEFAPQAVMTRGMLVTAIGRAEVAHAAHLKWACGAR